MNVLINGARLRPDRVVDILEACGALDLSSSLSRDVNSYFLSSVLFDFCFTLLDALFRFDFIKENSTPEKRLDRFDEYRIKIYLVKLLDACLLLANPGRTD